jgi:hypothetical protein
MAQFNLEIAGVCARVNGLFDSTPHHFIRYLSQKEPEFTITVIQEDLAFEQADADTEAAEEGFRQRTFPDPFLERASIQRKFAEHLLLQDVIPVHGSTVAVDGHAYLFTARSGTGKSTHTRLWREVFGPRAVMINDDKPFLRITPAGVTAYGSPWSGKHGLDSNIQAKLKGICLLERGVENAIRSANAQEVTDLLRGFRPQTAAQQERYDMLLNKLVKQIPLWHLDCNKHPIAAEIAYNTMSK